MIIGSAMVRVSFNFGRLIQPSLVALYGSHHFRPQNPVQVGTGFVIRYSDKTVVVTAAHTLWGHDGKEEPGEKAFLASGKLTYVGDCGGQVIRCRDIAIFVAEPLGSRRHIPYGSIQQNQAKMITIGGYLARDFRRGHGCLMPAPWIHTDQRVPVAQDLVGLRYTSKVVRQGNGKRVRPPSPSGLSGGPMIDAVQLALGGISVVGVFTEQSHGTARGEPSILLKEMLAAL